MTTAIKPTLSDLKEALSREVILLSPSKKKWLLDSAPKSFSYVQRVVLAYAQAKLANNPLCNWEKMVRSRFRISEADYNVVNDYLKGLV
tara:strand:- start:6173 stop:6439 length:267 start_codon:yes stop_codon:yes gene_type:complete